MTKTSTNGDARAYAERYLLAKLQPIPIRTDGTKAPSLDTWKELQDPARHCDLREFRNRGVGIICGAASGGAEFIDIDDPALSAAWCERVEDQHPGLIERLVLIQTPRANEAGQRGHHFAYRCPEPGGNLKLAYTADNTIAIETRGEGGYVVTVGSPPACHPSNRCYELLAGELTELPMLTMPERDVLLSCARSFDQQVKEEPKAKTTPAASADDERAGDHFARVTPWEEILTGWKQIGQTGKWVRPGKEGRGWSATTTCKSDAGRELFYVFSSNAAPFAADTYYNKFQAYAVLNHKGNWTAAAAALYALNYGKQDNSDTNIEAVVGQGAAADDNYASQAGKDQRNDDQKRQRPDFGRLTSDELLTKDFTVEYLIENVLADQQYGVISGRFKTQKTHLTVAAAISIASGTKFLNHFEVVRTRRVGMFCGEGGPAPLQRLAKAICTFQNVRPTQLDGLIWYTRVPRVSDVSHRMALLDAIAADKLEVIFLDPTYLLLSGVSEKAANFLVMANCLSLLTDIGQQTGIAANVVHHNKKSSELTVPDLDDLAFSGICEWAGQWLLLGHRAPFDADLKQSKLWLNIGGRLGHGGLYGVDVDELGTNGCPWVATVSNAKEARQGATDAKAAELRQKQQQEQADMIEKIKTAFRHAEGTDLPRRSLADRVGCRQDQKNFAAAVGHMLNMKELEETTVHAKNGRDAAGYRRLFQCEEDE